MQKRWTETQDWERGEGRDSRRRRRITKENGDSEVEMKSEGKKEKEAGRTRKIRGKMRKGRKMKGQKEGKRESCKDR